MPAFRNLIQRIPRGLLAFLDMKAGAAYPYTLAEVLQPTFDLQSWYAAEGVQMTAVGAAVGTTAAGNRLPFTATSVEDLVAGAGELVVPQTELWLFTQMCADCSGGVAAGDIFDVVPVIAANNVANRYYVPPTVLAGNPYNAVVHAAWRSVQVPPPGLIVTGGEEIQLLVLQATAAAGTPFTPTLRFRLMRFRA